MIRSLKGDHWLIQDEMGALWKMDSSSYVCDQMMQFHSGAIVGVDVSHSTFSLLSHFFDFFSYMSYRSRSSNSRIRWYSKTNRLSPKVSHLLYLQHFYSCYHSFTKTDSRFSAPGSCILWAPLSVDEDGRTVAVGFADGVLRVLIRCKDAFKVIHVSKPSTKKVTCLGYLYKN